MDSQHRHARQGESPKRYLVLWLSIASGALAMGCPCTDFREQSSAPRAPVGDHPPLESPPPSKGPAHLTSIVVSSMPLLGQAHDQEVFHATMHFDRPVRFTTHKRQRPRSGEVLSIYLPGCAPVSLLPATIPVGVGGIRAIHARLSGAALTEVALVMAPGTRPRISFLQKPFAIQVTFFPKTTPLLQSQRKFTLVLDPGHGGQDTGAKSRDGERESHLVMDIALRTKALLERRQHGLLVLLSRETDETVTLEDRALFANRLDADAFVSLHLNALEDPKEGGAATFVLDTSDDRHTRRLAARENGISESEVSDLQTVFASLERSQQMARSELLARTIQGHLMTRGRRHMPQLRDRGMRRGPFFVLAAVHMPAVLVEASFLTQPEEGRMLGTRRYRNALAEGIAEGILNYLALPQSGFSG
ncbi:MAG: N-acetylmuramoyl-L-alanine amidase [Myxococcales bacterium]|nr:N-acetylmuramoyl-L-alanine amidase [Myxococcales bacterium]